jgi:Holliday junction resolvase RusA-like endonuclease
MLPFEFTIQGPPVSHQTRNRQRLQQWKIDVAAAARAVLPGGSVPVPDPVEITITYYYEGDSPDVDNIIKPIQDALNGVVFVDDAQVAETKSRKRPLNGSYQIKGASGVLLQGFASGVGFLHVRVLGNTHNGVLDS